MARRIASAQHLIQLCQLRNKILNGQLGRGYCQVLTLAVCAAAVPQGLAAAPTAGAASQRPSIVFIVADDMDLGYLGCYGGSALTPLIDTLAATGTRFTEGYGVAAVCEPSRYSISLYGAMNSIPNPTLTHEEMPTAGAATAN